MCPDLTVSKSTASLSSTAVIGVSFRPGDEDGEPGGLDENAVLLLTEGNLLNIHFATLDLLGTADITLFHFAGSTIDRSSGDAPPL